MMAMNEKELTLTERVEVEIFNKAYVLRSAGGGARILEAARIVDERMRQISSQITTHDVVKIAVLTALNLADEMRDVKNYYEEEIRKIFSQTPGEQEESLNEGESAEKKQEDERPQSWFDNFFDSDVPVKDRSERLSSKISAKLQSLRMANQENISLESEEE
jgi:cell division protein ZapA (FtsZ GTPase activity inhibitor)